MWAEIGAYHVTPIESSEILAMAQPLVGMTPESPVDETNKPMPGARARTDHTATPASTWAHRIPSIPLPKTI